VTSKNPDLLKASAQQRLTDARRHLRALEAATAEFGGDFDLDAFSDAWSSNDPKTLHRAYAVQAGYENVINSVITAGREICELQGWVTGSSEPSSIEVLRALHENGVITAKVRQDLKDAQEMRSDVQHDYAGVAARNVHEAVLLVLRAAPDLIQDAAVVLR